MMGLWGNRGRKKRKAETLLNCTVKDPGGNKSSPEFCLKSNLGLTCLGELEVYSATVQYLL